MRHHERARCDRALRTQEQALGPIMPCRGALAPALERTVPVCPFITRWQVPSLRRQTRSVLSPLPLTTVSWSTTTSAYTVLVCPCTQQTAVSPTNTEFQRVAPSPANCLLQPLADWRQPTATVRLEPVTLDC